MSFGIFSFIVITGVVSYTLVYAFRNRRDAHNVSVLKESNFKLDGLLWILTTQFYPQLLNDISQDDNLNDNSRSALHNPDAINNTQTSIARRLRQYQKRNNKQGHKKLLQNLISIDTLDLNVFQDLE